jgi:transposase
MPAWVAVQNDNEFKEFYNKLISKGKKPKVAIVAVMRRLLVKLNGMMYDYFLKMDEQNI